MKSILLIVVAVVLAAFSGCDRKTNLRLAAADSLMEARPDSALAILDSVDSRSLSGENRAYYALLLTKAQYKNYITITSDSLINIAIDYYDSGDRHIEALIYKGAALQDMGLTTEAIDCYKKAESIIPHDDYELLGYVNLRLGNLYSSNYICNEEHVEKYKKALHYYSLSGNKIREITCSAIIGRLFGAIDMDSAYHYLNYSINLAKEEGDTADIFEGLSFLARVYEVDSMYVKSKNTAVFVIRNGLEYLTDNTCPFYDAARAYASLGMVDSAKYYFNKIPADNLESTDSVVWLEAFQRIKEAEGNYKEALKINALNSDLAFQIYKEAKQAELYGFEKKFDKSEVEFEKMRIQRLLAVVVLIFVVVIMVVWVIAKKRKDKIAMSQRLLEEMKDERQSMVVEHRNIYSKLSRQLEEASARLEEREHDTYKKLESLRGAFVDQLDLIKDLIDKSYTTRESQGVEFLKYFKEKVSTARLADSTWTDLREFINQVSGNMLDGLVAQCPEISDIELNIIVLMCCKFSMLEIMICMGYSNERTVFNKRKTIENKLGIDSPLDKYLEELMVCHGGI